MPPEAKEYGPRKGFEEIDYLGGKAFRSKTDPNLVVVQVQQEGGVRGYLYGYAVDPMPVEIGPAPPKSFEEARRVLEAEQERVAPAPPVFSAELLSLDPDDPRALASLVTDKALADLSAQLAENPELLNQEGMFEQWMNLALIEQGFATDPVMAATATKALGMGYLEMFASGELDSPDKAEDAARAFAQQIQTLTGFEEAALAEEERIGPEDELTALYEQQVKDEAEFQQRGFYRQGIMDLVSLAPAEARLGLMAGMLENPEISSLFFPKEPTQAEGGLPPESKFVIE